MIFVHWASRAECLTLGLLHSSLDPCNAALHGRIKASFEHGDCRYGVDASVASAYNSQVKPPARLTGRFGTYRIDCGAEAPDFHVKIGGKTFTIKGKDLILPEIVDGKEVCESGIQADWDYKDPDDISILGDPFLRSVVVSLV